MSFVKKNIGENKYKHKKDGITLIALTITIVVIIILAFIVIRLVLGDNGLIQRAKSSSIKTRESRSRRKITDCNSNNTS